MKMNFALKYRFVIPFVVAFFALFLILFNFWMPPATQAQLDDCQDVAISVYNQKQANPNQPILEIPDGFDVKIDNNKEIVVTKSFCYGKTIATLQDGELSFSSDKGLFSSLVLNGGISGIVVAFLAFVVYVTKRE